MYEHRDGRHHELVFGLILMTVGALFLLDHLEILSFSMSVRQFWPVILIGIGVAKLIKRSGSSYRIGDRR